MNHKHKALERAKVSKIDRRKNAKPYIRGIKPSSDSEYFGKSYGQLRREALSSNSKHKD